MSGDAICNESDNLSKDEKENILRKMGFVDTIIDTMEEYDIDDYCEKYRNGEGVEIETQCQEKNLNEEIRESFKASKEDFLQSINYSTSEEAIEEQIENVEEYEYYQKMYDDFLEMSIDELEEKYGGAEVETKEVKSIAENIDEDKEDKDNYNNEETNEVRCCATKASNSRVTLQLTWASDTSMNDLYAKRVRLHYNIENHNKLYNGIPALSKYKDVLAVCWNELMDVNGIGYSAEYKVGYYSNEFKESQARAIGTVKYSGTNQNKSSAFGIVNPYGQTKSESKQDYIKVKSDNFLSNIVSEKMVCWAQEKGFNRNYKGGRITLVPSNGTCYVSLTPNYKYMSSTNKFQLSGEYIYKTSSLQKYNGDLYTSENNTKYDNYFSADGKNTKSALLYGGVVNAASILGAATGGVAGAGIGIVATAASTIDYIKTNFLSYDDFKGPTCTVSREVDYYLRGINYEKRLYR